MSFLNHFTPPQLYYATYPQNHGHKRSADRRFLSSHSRLVAVQTKVENETVEDAKYFEWYNPVIQKYLNGELTEYELVNEIFQPFEQVNQVQAQLLGATFEMLSGGPAQTHVGTGEGGSSSDMPWGEKKNDNNLTTPRRKR